MYGNATTYLLFALLFLTLFLMIRESEEPAQPAEPDLTGEGTEAISMLTEGENWAANTNSDKRWQPESFGAAKEPSQFKSA